MGKELLTFDGFRNKSDIFIQESELYMDVNEDNHAII